MGSGGSGRQQVQKAVAQYPNSLLAGLHCAAGEEPSWYNCDCSGRDNCMCPSTDPPGGLSVEDTPQFILFTVRRLLAGQRRPLGRRCC
jgi:hypothetical protein